VTAFLLATPAYAQTPPAEPPAPPVAAAKPAAPEPKPIVSKSEITLYGTVDMTVLYDSVQNLGAEAAGGATIARDGSYAADHSRLQFSPRGSRLGLRVAAPEFDGIKVTGVAESDFVGNGGTPAAGAEGGFFTSPTFRIRHAWGKVSTSAVDVLFGQTWGLFGWVPSSVGFSVMVAGLPGALYSRNPQLRLTKVVKGDAVNVEVAVAAARPAQREAGTPDGQAGLRVLLNNVKGYRTPGPGGGVVEPLFIGVSGIARKFEVPAFAAMTTDSMSTTGFGVAGDVFIPIIPPQSKEEHAGALTLTGEGVYSQGCSDQYTGFTGGTGINLPSTLPPVGDMPGGNYTPNIDNGMIALNADQTDIEAVKWLTVTGGLQFYLTNKLWIAANGSYIKSDNIGDLTSSATTVYEKAIFFDGVLAVDVAAARFGLEVGRFQQTYVDGQKPTSFRVQFGSWYFF